MLPQGIFPIAVGANTPIHISGYPDTMGILVYNESPYQVNVAMDTGNYLQLMAQTGDCCLVPNGFSGTLTATALPYLSDESNSNAPSYVISVVSLAINDALTKALLAHMPTGFPISLNRLASIGNSVNTKVSGILQNDNNPSGTQIVETTVQGQGSSNQTVTNDGIWVLATVIAGALHQFLKTNSSGNLLQLGNATDTVEILGPLLVDALATLSSLSVSGTSQLTGIATLTAAPHLTAKQLQDGSGNVLADWSQTANSQGLLLNGNPAFQGHVEYRGKAGTTQADFKISAISPTDITGSANGTYNHGMQQFGSAIAPNSSDILSSSYTGAAPGSQTLGVTAPTTTTVYITAGAGLGFAVKVGRFS